MQVIFALMLFGLGLDTVRADDSETTDNGVVWAGIERHKWAWIVGGIFSILACSVSFREIYLQLRYNQNDAVRKWIVRVFLMVPIYSVEAWLGLWAHHYTEYWDLMRECYEAYAIYAFYMFLLWYLGGRRELTEKQRLVHDHAHMAPCCCLPIWPNYNGSFTRRCTIGVLQYVPIKLVTAFLTFIFSKTELYHNGTFKFTDAYPYIALIVNFSQLIAMYCLVLFLHANQPQLLSIRPIPKLLCIKLVVFFTFWQSVAIAGLVHLGKITETRTYSVEEASAGLQDFIICIEMLFAALAHRYAFPYLEFNAPTPATSGADGDTAAVVSTSTRRPIISRLVSVFNQRDIIDHISETVAPGQEKEMTTMPPAAAAAAKHKPSTDTDDNPFLTASVSVSSVSMIDIPEIDLSGDPDD